MNKRYAVMIQGMKIMTVLGKDEREAQERAHEQLARPGRFGVLSAWIADGSQVMEMDEYMEQEQ